MLYSIFKIRCFLETILSGVKSISTSLAGVLRPTTSSGFSDSIVLVFPLYNILITNITGYGRSWFVYVEILSGGLF